MRYQHCPSSPLPLFERITSCYCVDREGQELGREAGLGPSEWGGKGGAKENVTVGTGGCSGLSVAQLPFLLSPTCALAFPSRS